MVRNWTSKECSWDSLQSISEDFAVKNSRNFELLGAVVGGVVEDELAVGRHNLQCEYCEFSLLGIFLNAVWRKSEVCRDKVQCTYLNGSLLPASIFNSEPGIYNNHRTSNFNNLQI